jgi:AcrR family transcriptional regulator
LRTPPRSRRSHAERTAETRARIIAAVLECIAELGFQRTTAVEITRRAGVTWGAVQHHFGGKDGILTAVLEDSFNRFAARLDDIAVDETDLPRRTALFLARAWDHFGSAEYRSTFEILLNYVGREDGAAASSWQGQMFRAWDEVWMRIFHDAPISRPRHRLLEHYTVATLSGLGSTLMLEGPEARIRPDELALLERTLVRELLAEGVS